jgi:hypothetical protein
MDIEYISLPTVKRIDFCSTGCSGEYLDIGIGKRQEICKKRRKCHEGIRNKFYQEYEL